jgi:nucleoside-diphosphate-sugar epimerase
MRVLVLGSQGVIGTSLVEKLKEDNHTVIEHDITISDKHDLRSHEFEYDYDFCFFLSYDVGGSKYISKTDKSFIDNNVHIMLNTFKCLEKNGKPFLFASSQMQNMDCSYGALKRLGEYYTDSLGGVSIRFWNIYGKEIVNEKSHVIPDIIDQYKTTGEIKLMTTGHEERQFLHSKDCAECLVTIMNNFENIKSKVKYVDVTSFEWMSIYDLARKICDKVIRGEISSQNIKNEPNTFILDYWKPKIDIDSGLKAILN